LVILRRDEGEEEEGQEEGGIADGQEGGHVGEVLKSND
jgi:hypothetical protein